MTSRIDKFQGIKRLIAKQRAFYKKIVSVDCPILGEVIFFTSEGFNHLLYESNRMPRKLSERYLKLIFLSYVVRVIKNCSEVAETRKVKRKMWGKYKKILWYKLVYEVSPGVRVSVIIEKIGNGKCRFKSVMPSDKKSKKISKRLNLAAKKRR